MNQCLLRLPSCFSYRVTLTQYLFLLGLKFTSATFTCAFINMVPVNTFIMALPFGWVRIHWCLCYSVYQNHKYMSGANYKMLWGGGIWDRPSYKFIRRYGSFIDLWYFYLVYPYLKFIYSSKIASKSVRTRTPGKTNAWYHVRSNLLKS